MSLPEIGRRTFLRTGLMAVGAVALESCTSKPRVSPTPGLIARPTVRIPGGDFGFPSPFGYIAGPGYVRMSLIYDTLVWKDGSGQLLPWLASSYSPSKDGLTYTFQLRDALWHDGHPFTADDVEFTFTYFARLLGKLPPLVVAQPFGVASAKATGPRTVEITLPAPFVTFAEQIAGSIPIFPKHIWSTVTDPVRAQDPKVLVGTGPYRLQSYSSGEGSYLYIANDTYFLGKPFVRRIELVPAGDELQAVRAGSTDGGEAPAVGVPPAAVAPFTSGTFGSARMQGGFAFPLYWNLARGGALADVRFRQACAMAIDRGDIVTRLLGGQGLPGNPGFLPPDHPDFVQVEQYAFNVAGANSLLDRAGYRRPSANATRQAPDGTPLRFELLTGGQFPVVELVVQSLKAIGVELVPRNVELATFFGVKFSGKWDMIITLYPGPGGQNPESDPDQLRLIYASNAPPSAAQAFGYKNPQVDRLTQAQLVAPDAGSRRTIVGQIQQLVAHDLPVLPLYYSTLFFAFDKSVLDQWYYTPGGLATGLPTPYNKQLFVTGSKTGVQIRPAR